MVIALLFYVYRPRGKSLSIDFSRDFKIVGSNKAMKLTSD